MYKFLRIGEQTAKIAKICLSRKKTTPMVHFAVLIPFKALFMRLERGGTCDVNSDIDLFLPHEAFQFRINKCLRVQVLLRMGCLHYTEVLKKSSVHGYNVCS